MSRTVFTLAAVVSSLSVLLVKKQVFVLIERVYSL